MASSVSNPFSAPCYGDAIATCNNEFYNSLAGTGSTTQHCTIDNFPFTSDTYNA